MTLLRIAPAAALLAAAACGAGEDADDDRPAGGPGPNGSGATVYQGALTVIETPDHGPQLAGALAESYPPQGGGLDVEGWDWDEVEHESSQGTSWGDYLVTGTFDGEAFVLTEDPVHADEVDMADYPHLQYTEPDIDPPAEELGAEELDGVYGDLSERFPALVLGGWVDQDQPVAVVEVVLVTPELAEHVQRSYPEGAVVLVPMLEPVSE
ncbi:hypothetical protein [Glycomyces xiaoerkulensis]|uniref:hypothetical protein n=1 Tax=Glycomyces xiaoerkulensis TaxID=2038139 RepID=UPI0012FFE5EA|nr:hypothetical protein [Glycomyces xiaoerkulensis]